MKNKTDSRILRMMGALKLIRRNKGYSQEYMRSSTGIDVSRIEHGDCLPGIKTFDKLCKKYSICPGWLWILTDYVDKGELSQKEMENILLNWDQVKETAKAITDCFVSICENKEHPGDASTELLSHYRATGS